MAALEFCLVPLFGFLGGLRDRRARALARAAGVWS